ncbi:hypothetical protein GMMP1_330013 [Candidatus Magnetomoraceae bacterium gMMP-1]
MLKSGVLITYPLKQGLKQKQKLTVLEIHQVLITYPLKQGLKLFIFLT